MKKTIKGIFGRFNIFIKKSSYSNKILNDKEIIFIHVPKVAGSAILSSLNIKQVYHIPLHIYEFENKALFSKYYKIGFVRNPWDRLVSSFHYLKTGGSQNKYDLYMKKELERFATFRDFVLEISENKKFRENIIKEIHFRPQYSWMVNSIGEIEMDYVGFFEKLPEGFEMLKNKMNKCDVKLNKTNSSKHKPYWFYYDQETISIVGNLYKKDINIFEYEFPYDKIESIANHKY